MENKFVVGEFVVFKGFYGNLHTVVCITGEKLQDGYWPAVVWDSKVGLHIPEQKLFKIDWERKMESSPIERAVVALESIAESLKGINDAVHTDDGATLASLVDHEVGDISRILRQHWNIYNE